MKKTLFSAIIALLFISVSNAQESDYRIGITIGPTISYVRANTDGNSTSIDRDGSQLKFLLGAFIDMPFKENYFFHGGINFASRSTKISVDDPAFFGGTPTASDYEHEYLQLPVLLKLYTNEIMLDTKLFFNFGVIPEIRLNTANKTDGVNLITEFQNFDVSGNFGGGIERAIGVNTNVFVSLNYNIGFLNQVKEQSTAVDELKIKNNLIAIEFGIKF